MKKQLQLVNEEQEYKMIDLNKKEIQQIMKKCNCSYESVLEDIDYLNQLYRDICIGKRIYSNN
jgi:hypothetical protein